MIVKVFKQFLSVSRKGAVRNKGKSMPFGNNAIKITYTKDIKCEECKDNEISVPRALPLEDVKLRSSRPCFSVLH